MKTRFYLLLPIFISTFFFSQDKKEPRLLIDSIQNTRWLASSVSLDSLDNPVVNKVITKFNDEIVLKKGMDKQPASADIVPITPFGLNHLKENKKWYLFGHNNLIFNQASFSNWNSGGINNIGVIGKVNYNLSYRNNKHYFENIVELGYGWIASEGLANRKTEDYINLMVNYGYDIGKNFFLSSGFKLVTQFAPGYNYTETPDPDYNDRISEIMAPGYINAGIGISYNPNENFQVIFRPINGKLTLVLDEKLQTPGRYGLEEYGQAVRKELGAMANFVYRIALFKDIILDQQLNFFTNYIEHTERVDIAYKTSLNFKFNKLITTTVSLDITYDHDQIKAVQRKQTLGIGIVYNFGTKNERSSSKGKNLKPYVAP